MRSSNRKGTVQKLQISFVALILTLGDKYLVNYQDKNKLKQYIKHDSSSQDTPTSVSCNTEALNFMTAFFLFIFRTSSFVNVFSLPPCLPVIRNTRVCKNRLRAPPSAVLWNSHVLIHCRWRI